MRTKTSRDSSARAKPRQAGSIGNFDEQDDDDTQIVSALSRGLLLLDAFTRDDVSLGNAKLAERTGLSKSTVSRLAYTLAMHNYLSFDARSREYRLGTHAIMLGATALASTNVRTTALPLMRHLARGSHFNVGLGTRNDLQMMYSDTAEGDALVALRLYPGSRVPMATSAMGRAYLAAIGDVERNDILDRLRLRYDDDWGRIRKGVEDALAQWKQCGYCASIGDWQKDINGVAVPIQPLPGTPLYVLNLGGPAYALPESQLRDEFAPRLVETARQIEATLGIIPALKKVP